MLFRKKTYRPYFWPLGLIHRLLAKASLRRMPVAPVRRYDSQQRAAGLPMLVSHQGQHQCNGCGLCPEYCPARCLELHMKDGRVQALNLDWTACIQCGICWEICPTQALSPVSHLLSEGMPGRPLTTKVNLVSLVRKK